MTSPREPQYLDAQPQVRDQSAARAHAADTILLSSESLLQGRRVIEIDHNGQCYRLSHTRQGKLILTK
ncbi:MAG: Hemin uptake protein hemP [Rhizobacter sp.]|nr:Hemin uptake protein hemP [Rhizobacter sp.]